MYNMNLAKLGQPTAKLPESQLAEQLAAALATTQTPGPDTITEDDPDAKSAFDAVMSALAAQPEPVAELPKAIETEVRPAVKHAAAAPNTQTMRDTVAAAAKTVQAAPAQAYFISRYPKLVLYVDIGFREKHQGAQIVRNVPIQFKDGQYLTDNESIAKALRDHPKFNGMFQEAKSKQVAAFVAGAAKARQMLRNQVTSGPASSADSNDHQQMMRDAELGNVEQQLFKL